MSAPAATQSYALPSNWAWFGPIVYVLGLSVLWLSRFGGLWAEGDSGVFARHISDVARTGVLTPEEAYPNGYLYQTISTFLMSFADVDVATLQQWLYPMLAAFIVPAAWLTFRELTISTRWATVCTLLLFAQSEFLFVIMRSSHEKFSRMLMLLCILLIARMVLRHREASKTVLAALSIPALLFAMLSSNYLLGSSFIIAIGTVYLAAFVAARVRPHLQPFSAGIVGRLPYTLISGFVIAYIFMYYVYPPAIHDLLVLRDSWELVTALFTETATGSGDVLVAYRGISDAWVSMPVYLLVSAANWALLLGSLALWIRRGVQWIVQRQSPSGPLIWLLWLLYGAFVLQGGLAIIADASGAMSSNLQVRLFPGFSIVAIALIGAEAAHARFEFRLRRRGAALLAGAVCVLTVLAVLKATNEPSLSNKWSFYRTTELAAVQWADNHIAPSSIWAEFDERLIAAYRMTVGKPANVVTSSLISDTRTIIVSDITRLRAARTGNAPPVPPDALTIYDNGFTQVFRLRPQTPYQP